VKNTVRSWSESAYRFVKIHQNKLFFGGFALIVVFYLLLVGLAIGHQPVGFDEGWDLQAPLNMAKHGHYASQGGMWGGITKPFDPYLSTGPSVQLPIAVMFKLFGVGAIQARLVIVAFYLAVLILITWYVYGITKSKYALLAPLTILILMAPPIKFQLDILGEFPAIAYALASLIAWRKQKFFWAGLFAALAVLSKAIMFFLIFAAAGLFFVWLLRNWRHKISVIISGLKWAVGIALPLGAWELFKFIQLGGYRPWWHNWHEYIEFFKVTGSGLAPNGTVLSYRTKFDMLTSTIQLPRVAFVLAVLGILLLIGLRYANLLNALRKQAYALLFIALYLAWWFLKSNGGFVRYVIPVSGIIIATAWATALVAQNKKMPQAVYWLRAAICLVVGVLLLAAVHRQFFPIKSPSFSPTLQTEQLVAKRVADSHPTTLTHLGFWQNPEIEFLGNLHSTEQSYRPVGSQFQLLLSPTMKNITPTDYEKGRKECTKIYFEQDGYLYCLATKTS